MTRISASDFQKLHGPKYKPGLPMQTRPLENNVQRGIVEQLRWEGYRTAKDICDDLRMLYGKNYDKGHLLQYATASRLKGIYEVLGTKRKRGDHQGTMQSAGVSDVQVFTINELGISGVWRVIEVKRDGKAKVRPEQEIKVWLAASEIRTG